ncbi:S49 family peptidase [Pseudomonas sp. GOM6]|uniref:S49 family peptidase n=1 Tax=Pseudomonas sp. GOM6 TaxID=3036944 RepID=UPI00240979B4|nr:S49 family peptidase [Pseudomonas sp. GOM6]MDG1580801.1 S49 family peptidase [Pseudomonas sp. GOM6]
MASVTEQRRARRWKLVYRFCALGLVGSIFAFSQFSSGSVDATGKPHTAVINVRGEITDNSMTSAGMINQALRNAFEAENAKGIILYINSPGGSPVQAGQVADEIHRLRAKYPAKKLHAVIGDLGASGGYYMAAAADDIYADKASLVGSIGVTAASFGYVDLMKTVGVERRAYTSGEHKAFLDPFQPENPEEIEFWSGVLGKTHQQFIGEVIKGRGDRLKLDGHDDVFSGLIWTGEQAKELGLIDELGSVETVARDVVKAEDLVDYTVEENRFDVFARKLGASVIAEAVTAVTQRVSSFQSLVLR